MFLDCDENADSEIFIVEGRSAGDAIRPVRNRQTQAVLAMQGKIPNPARRSNANKIARNPQIQVLTQALQANNQSSRFARICLLCDADIDGLHARALLTMYFVVYLPHLLQQGRVFVVHPPLYKVCSTQFKLKKFIWSKLQLQQIESDLASRGCVDIQREHFKGIASLQAEDLLSTCINAQSRTISPVTPDDGAAVLSSYSRNSVKS